MVCAVFPFYKATGELKNNGHEKVRKERKDATRWPFDDLSSLTSF